MTTISQNYGVGTIKNNAVQPKSITETEHKCSCRECSDDKKEINLNQSPEAALGKAMVQLQQAKDSMDEVYETLLAYSTGDGMLSGMDYDDALHSATILNSMKNR